MKTQYTLDPIGIEDSPSIFLAGPTHRDRDSDISRSWRTEAINLFSIARFNGTLYIPEFDHNGKSSDWMYSRQVDWESKALTSATVILFWIPRDKDNLPGFTTNIEFGEWLNSNKIVVGFPKEAYAVKYIEERCSRSKIQVFHTLQECVNMAISMSSSKPLAKHWFTSDTHFGEKRTMELSRRSFKTVEEMDWTIIKNWNSVIKSNDIVFHLGDFGNPFAAKHLNGKINLLVGNYDKDSVVESLVNLGLQVITGKSVSLTIGSNNFKLVHYPSLISEMTKENEFALFGHIHKLQMVKRNALNVGVDCHNFYPIDLDEVLFYKNAILNHYDEEVFV